MTLPRPWRIKRGARLAAMALTVCALFPAAARAQQPEAGSAKALFSSLVSNRLTNANFPEAALRTQALLDEFTKGIAIGITTVPVGSSSAGFAYEFDSRTGEHTLKSQSFGPLFVERPYTNGRGVFDFGAAYTYNAYSEFQGLDIVDRGLLLFDNRVRFLDDNYQQFIEEYLTIDARVSTVNLLASYGVTRSLDIGVVVPVSTVDFDARRYWDYDVARSYAAVASDRAFYTPGPRATNWEPALGQANSGEVSETGIGDIALRAKYAFGAQGPRAVAAVVDVRLPTGDEDNFLGTGKTSTRLSLVGTTALNGSVAMHFNGGYRFGGLTDEGDYAVAFDAALLASKKLTVSAEFLGQYLNDAVFDIGEITNGPLTLASSLAGVPVNVVYSAVEPQLLTGGVNNLRGAFGAKYNIFGTTLLTGGVLIPLTDNGLRSSFTAFVGLEVNVSGR